MLTIEVLLFVVLLIGLISLVGTFVFDNYKSKTSKMKEKINTNNT